MAIFTYGKVNGLLTKQDLKRAAHHVSLATKFIVLKFDISKQKN
jgi:hypothetical protein